MIVSLCGLIIVDYLVHVNLIGFLPDELRGQLGVEQVGTAEFFGFLYIAYEIVSVLKNMYLCGLPVKKIWDTVRRFLQNYTDELPDAEEIEKKSQTEGLTDQQKANIMKKETM